MKVGPLDLLIIQGTPFCNLDCTYCYLPDRANTDKISLTTVEKILDRVFESNIIQKNFTLLWHAGEPLVMPLSFYKEVSVLLNAKNQTSYKARQNFQTNATLLNQEWCDYLLENENSISISVSLDGPEIIHNNQRLYRNGKGTYSSVLQGISHLQKNNIGYGIISVITDFTLDYPDEFYHYFKNLNPKILGLNVEEVEGANYTSTLYNNNNDPKRFYRFIQRLYDLYISDNRQLPIREFQQIEKFILRSKRFKNNLGQQTTPYRILTIDVNGNYSTFSPEMLTMKYAEQDNFIIGNVFEGSLTDALKTKKFESIYNEILEGILMCKNDCKYFNVCGGGIPSNKYSEHKTFKATVTNHCKFKSQWLFDTVLDNLEQSSIQQIAH